MIYKLFIVIVIATILASCTSIPDKLDSSFDLGLREDLYRKDAWLFSGRMSVVDEKHAVSASIEWRHHNKKEEIKLSGPFSLGKVRVVLTETDVEIDSAGKQVNYAGNVDDVVSTELGVAVPVSVLKYWVLGVTDPDSQYMPMVDGFVQHGWRVRYIQMQNKGGYDLPKKIIIELRETRLKLIIDHWDM